MEPSRDTVRLVEIMRALRDKETGCPWDLEQTFDTIVPYTIEETFEVVDAIERRDPEGLKEELGDLLLQVIYFSQLAQEIGFFSYGDVVEGITKKMIRRHPHVFGDESARSARSAKSQWNRIKEEEKQERTAETVRRHQTGRSRTALPGQSEWLESKTAVMHGLLDEIPGNFPALLLARKIQDKAATIGFDWQTADPIVDKLREETAEFVAADTMAERQNELGDLLFTIVNLARRYEIDPDMALRGTIRKFRDRFRKMEIEAQKSARLLNEMSLAELEALWTTAKSASSVLENS